MESGLINAALDVRNGWRITGLATALARARWADVEASIGLVRAKYGTVRFLTRDPSASRNDLTTVSFDTSSRADASVIVEVLDNERLQRYSSLGLEFYGPGEMDGGVVHHRLKGALQRLREVPEAAATVRALVVILHVLKPAGADHDVSYSDPLVPFSIFVGINAEESKNSDLRLAESILHECMHLQLTLIEGVVPLVTGAEELHQSPWQQTLRPSQGILHGLYVFRAIQDFYRTLLDGRRCAAAERKYIMSRVKTIDQEVEAVGELSASSDLTSAGKRLVATLLAG
jgi:HEXXH motif-containing protein